MTSCVLRPVDVGVLAGVIDDDALEQRRGQRPHEADLVAGLGVEDHHVFALRERQQRELAVGREGDRARAGDDVVERARRAGHRGGLNRRRRPSAEPSAVERGEGREHGRLEVEIGLRRLDARAAGAAPRAPPLDGPRHRRVERRARRRWGALVDGVGRGCSASGTLFRQRERRGVDDA